MAQEYAVFVEGLQDLKFSKDNEKAIRAAASKAINKVTRDARVKASKEIRKQVNLPARYVAPGNKNLYVSEKASPGSLQGKITARGRPTSLARFVRGRPREGKAGIYVEVAPGRARFMKRAFLIRLPGLGGLPIWVQPTWVWRSAYELVSGFRTRWIQDGLPKACTPFTVQA